MELPGDADVRAAIRKASASIAMKASDEAVQREDDSTDVSEVIESRRASNPVRRASPSSSRASSEQSRFLAAWQPSWPSHASGNFYNGHRRPSRDLDAAAFEQPQTASAELGSLLMRPRLSPGSPRYSTPPVSARSSPRVPGTPQPHPSSASKSPRSLPVASHVYITETHTPSDEELPDSRVRVQAELSLMSQSDGLVWHAGDGELAGGYAMRGGASSSAAVSQQFSPETEEQVMLAAPRERRGSCHSVLSMNSAATSQIASVRGATKAKSEMDRTTAPNSARGSSHGSDQEDPRPLSPAYSDEFSDESDDDDASMDGETFVA